MNNTHDKIYLINAGDEITWCDDPAPAPNMDEYELDQLDKFLEMVER